MTDPVRHGPARPLRRGVALAMLAVLLVGFITALQAMATHSPGSETLAAQGVRAGSGHAGAPLVGLRPAGPFTIHPTLTEQKVDP